jgi:hypothetical protein
MAWMVGRSARPERLGGDDRELGARAGHLVECGLEALGAEHLGAWTEVGRAAIQPKPPSAPMKTTRGTTSKTRQAASIAVKMGRTALAWIGGRRLLEGPRCAPSATGACRPSPPQLGDVLRARARRSIVWRISRSSPGELLLAPRSASFIHRRSR